MKLIFLGPPGVGKGTQAAKLASYMGLLHLSTGVMFREAVSQGTIVGVKVKSILDSGNLVPDELVCELVEEKLESILTGFVLDGFPRTLDQAKSFDAYLKQKNQCIDKVISFKLSEDEILRRLTTRSVKENRTDDSKEVIHKRLEVYLQLTEPLISYYKEINLLVELDGLGTEDDVYKRLNELIKK